MTTDETIMMTGDEDATLAMVRGEIDRYVPSRRWNMVHTQGVIDKAHRIILKHVGLANGDTFWTQKACTFNPIFRVGFCGAWATDDAIRGTLDRVSRLFTARGAVVAIDPEGETGPTLLVAPAKMFA